VGSGVEICCGRVGKLGRRMPQLLTRWYNSCPRGIMLNLITAVRQLKKERERARREVGRLDEALKILGSLGSLNPRLRRVQTIARKRTMSAAARKRIAAAQRARWAKWKAARRNK
jgi:hypothetical protein